ncbi:hypothetical protein EL753P1_00052 [Eggerthella phage EL753P1]|nr:hypothetical protein EL753P1_00052 [Eggerthella phage EL753P1]
MNVIEYNMNRYRAVCSELIRQGMDEDDATAMLFLPGRFLRLLEQCWEHGDLDWECYDASEAEELEGWKLDGGIVEAICSPELKHAYAIVEKKAGSV